MLDFKKFPGAYLIGAVIMWVAIIIATFNVAPGASPLDISGRLPSFHGGAGSTKPAHF